MILIFGSFILGGERIIALFGNGLAGAVVIDALIVRSTLVRTLMILAGKANWWLPAHPRPHPPPPQRRRKQPTTTSQANTPPGGSRNNQSRRNDGSSAGASAPSLLSVQLFPPLTEAQVGRRHRDLLCNPHGGAGSPARLPPLRGKGDSSVGSICNFLSSTRAATVSSSARIGGLSSARATCSPPTRSRTAATPPIPRSTVMIAIERPLLYG